MRFSTLRIVIIFGTLAVIGMLITQTYWIKKAFDKEQREFNLKVNYSLHFVGEQILKYKGNFGLPSEAVEQHSDNYFTVMVNDNIDAATLEILLKKEFQRRGIVTDFEYGIYDCEGQNMIYGNYVNTKGVSEPIKERQDLPKHARDNYYFGVYFPNRQSYVAGELGIWIFSTLALVIVIGFFLYAISAMLKQRRLSEVQKDFINNMTHEFKTPLSTIQISSNVLKNPEIIKNPLRLINYATIIHNEAVQLTAQVERVLQLASIKEGNISLNIEKSNINNLLQKIKDNSESILTEKNATINLHLPSRVIEAQIDTLHFGNCIKNLIDNALKYCKEPQINITLSTKQDGNSKQNFIVTVADNGQGIASEHLPYLFDTFYRVPTGNVHNVKGFGLGLNYVKLIIKAHNGKATVSSQLNKGTTFALEIPYN
jgi:two-component system phosphate regulon sensor histidine kinase PhoR